MFSLNAKANNYSINKLENDSINKIELIESAYRYFGLEKELKSNKSNAQILFVDKYLYYYLNESSKKTEFLEKYTAKQWQYVFEHTYNDLVKNNNLFYKVNFILGQIYHAQEKFIDAPRFLEIIYKNRNNVNEAIYKSTLIKLEECYRITKDFSKSIEIRNKRIERKYINSYWEIYRDFYLYDLAIEDFNKNVEIPNENTIKILRYYLHKGDLYLLNNEIEKAKLNYQKGLERTKYFINQKDSNNVTLLLNYHLGYFIGSIAICDIRNGKIAESIDALLYNNQLNVRDITNKKIVWTELAKCYILLKDKKSSKNAIQQVKYYSNLSSYDTIVVSKILADYFEMTGKYDSSNYYLKMNQHYNNLLYNKIINNKVQLYLIKYNNEKLNNNLNIEKVKYANLFIILLINALILSLLIYFYLIQSNNFKNLQKTNDELNLLANELSTSNRNKIILLKELNHRVKNNLQLINSYMNIKSRDYQYNADIDNFVDEIQKRILVISSIYEIIYKTDSYEILKLEDLIPQITSNIIQIFQSNDFSIKAQYDIEPIEVSSNIGLFICLIINESISNSTKYGFYANSSNNIISIQIRPLNENQFHFTISDNGTGIDETNSKLGFGLNFMKLISQQLNAEYNIYSSSEGVTHDFKIKYHV